MIGITLLAGGNTLNQELLEYFDFSIDTPTPSAYIQQRAKVLPEAFEYIFHMFTEKNSNCHNTYKGYRLIASDGSDLSIAKNPNDPETVRKSNQSEGISNHIHLNAFYDVLNRIYTDVYLQNNSEYNEKRACVLLTERSKLKNVLLLADRGYENYNIFAHIIEKGWKFLIRVKDIDSNGIVSGLSLPDTEIFDTDINLILTRKYTNYKKANYKYMPNNQVFDYIPIKTRKEYSISFRVVRVKITDDTSEVLITNLERDVFPPEELKILYNFRWGIETSFRELKYAIGLTHFHSKKTQYIRQEIYARLILYNYCELITTHVIELMEDKKEKQVNFTSAISLCKEFLKQKRKISPPDLIKHIEKRILPIRPGRRNPRKVKAKADVSFIYRVA